jgi:hypothetical protein
MFDQIHQGLQDAANLATVLVDFLAYGSFLKKESSSRLDLDKALTASATPSHWHLGLL